MNVSWRFVVPLIFVCSCLVILISLGNWQWYRLVEKEDLIEAVATRSQQTAFPLPTTDSWALLKEKELIYSHFSFTGSFIATQNIYRYTFLRQAKGPLSGDGYKVLTPFKISDGRFVIVDRGFLPKENRNIDLQTMNDTKEEVTITGLVIPHSKRNMFTPQNNQRDNIWYHNDWEDMIEWFELDINNVFPYIVSLNGEYTPVSGLPQAGEIVLKFKNNHLGYLITWYGLALALIVMYGYFLIQQYREIRSDNVDG